MGNGVPLSVGRSGLLFWILALNFDKPRAYLYTAFRVVVNVAFWA